MEIAGPCTYRQTREHPQPCAIRPTCKQPRHGNWRHPSVTNGDPATATEHATPTWTINIAGQLGETAAAVDEFTYTLAKQSILRTYLTCARAGTLPANWRDALTKHLASTAPGSQNHDTRHRAITDLAALVKVPWEPHRIASRGVVDFGSGVVHAL